MQSPEIPEKLRLLRFLIIQTAFIGDTILATPLIEKLHLHYPEATIDLFVRQDNSGLFKNHPYIDQLFTWNKRGRHKYLQLIPLVKALRQRRYSHCFNLQRHATTGFITLLSGAKNTVGFTMNPLSRLFTRTFVHRINSQPALSHETDLYLQLISDIVPPGNRVLPKLYPSSDDFSSVKRQSPYCTVAPSSVWFTKQYPAEKWVAVLNSIDKSMSVCLIGGKADHPLCEFIRQNTTHPATVNLAGSLSLLQSAALMKGALMNYANDSSPVHLASSVDAPVTAVFCSTTPAFGYYPLSSISRVVESDESIDCKPCGPHGHTKCPLGHFKCSNISPEKIIARQVTSSHA